MLVEFLPVVDGCLVGALSLLVWHQRRSIAALQSAHVELANRLGTIQQQTGVDALTGLRTQQMFEIKVSTLLRRAAPFALIYIDLDGLKSVNDRLGHAAGDRMIRLAVRAIRSAVRRRADLDSLFRRGTAADEFFWIVEGSRITVAVQLAEQLLTALRSVSLSASIGVAEWGGRTIASCQEIELAAEQQMQRAKRDGRNCVRWKAEVVEHTAPAALPSQSSQEAVPQEILDDVTVRDAA